MKAIVSLMMTLMMLSISEASKSSDKAEPNNFVADVWTEGVDVMRVLLKECSKKLIEGTNETAKEQFSMLTTCMKGKALRALDRTLSSDVISLIPGVRLVKYDVESNETKQSSKAAAIDADWRYEVVNKMAGVFDTHVIKFDLREAAKSENGESRGRKRRSQMMQMMMFGIVSMGMILVPMGFQFLAVLGGKALLLAKMALLLSSIQGLKKIATSPLNYGLYATYPAAYEGHAEKRTKEEWSRPPIIKSEDVYDESDRSHRIKNRIPETTKRWSSYPRYPEVYYPQYAPSYPGHFDGDHFGYSLTPSDIHAEYTVEVPGDKLQLKSNNGL